MLNLVKYCNFYNDIVRCFGEQVFSCIVESLRQMAWDLQVPYFIEEIYNRTFLIPGSL